jgi:hypothetical protein
VGWIVAVVVVLGVIMSILDTTIVNVALDTLSRGLHSSLSTVGSSKRFRPTPALRSPGLWQAPLATRSCGRLARH